MSGVSKCKKGYRKVGDRCILNKKKRIFSSGSKMTSDNLAVRNVLIGYSFVLAFIWVINPLARGAVAINLVFAAIAFLVYCAPEYQDDLVGIKKSTNITAILYGVLFTFLFFIVTLLVPGMSLGFPTVPASIADSLKFFLVVLVAPVIESIFFQGALYAYINNLDKTPTPREKWRAIIIQALAFSLFHLGAYIVGFYQYPDFAAGLGAVWANISSFIVAFAFALIAGWMVTKNNIRNLLFAIVFHLGLNLVAYVINTVKFSIGA